MKQLETEYRRLVLNRLMLKYMFKYWEILKTMFLRILLYWYKIEQQA